MVLPRQAKCGRCGVIFEWDQTSPIRLKDAFCPYCGLKLSQTSRMSHTVRVTQDPVLDPRLSLRHRHPPVEVA